MGDVLFYDFPGEPDTKALVPYSVRNGIATLSVPQKHSGSTRTKESDLTESDITFLNNCAKRAFDDLTVKGYTVIKP